MLKQLAKIGYSPILFSSTIFYINMPTAERPLPITVFTGFLGSGKYPLSSGI